MRRKPIAAVVAALIALAVSHVTVTSTAAGAAPAAPTVVDTIAVGAQPYGVAFSPDGSMAYVGNSGADTISVIDVATREVTTITGRLGPAGVAVTPDGSKVFVTAFGAAFDMLIADHEGVLTVTAADLAVAASGSRCVNPLAITMRDDGTAAYVGCEDGRITSVQTGTSASALVYQAGNQVRDIAYVPQGTKAQDDIAFIENVILGSPTSGNFRLLNANVTAQLPGYGMSIAVDRDGARAYVGDVTGILSVFDIAGETLLHTINVGGDLRGIALSQDHRLAYVTDNGGDSLKVVDLVARTVTHTVTVGAGALRVALSPDERTLLVTNNVAGSVSLLSIPAPDCGPIVDGRHLVSTAAHLASIGAGGAGTGPCGLGASYLQTADISLLPPVAPATSNHVPIGSLANPFTGTYDGGGWTIDALTVHQATDDQVGMFARTFGASLRDVNLTGAVIVGRDYVGSLVGLQSGTIVAASVSGRVEGRNRVGGLIGSLGGDSSVEDSSSAAVVVGTGNEVGGLVGAAQGGDVTSSHATGDVSGVRRVGGLVGYVSSGSTSVVTSFATGDVTTTGNDAGGLVGENEGTIAASFASGAVATSAQGVGGLVGTNFGAIEDAFAAGSVEGWSMAGGLVGGQFGTGTISRSFAVGQVTGGGAAGLLQFLDGYSPTASFWDTQTTGRPTSAGGTGLPTSQLRSIDTFADVGWSITPRWAPYLAGQSVWGICPAVNDGYPFLLWRFTVDPCGPTEAPVEVPAEQPGSGGGPGPDPDASVGEGGDGPSDAVSDRTGVGAVSGEGSAGRTVRCGPAAPRVGQMVVCELSGGDVAEPFTWRAAYNPTFAEGTDVLDASGSGTFAFVIPVEALGSPVTVEVVGWGGSVTVAERVGAVVPGSIPAGSGPRPVAGSAVFLSSLLAVLLLLVGGLVGTRRVVPGGSVHARDDVRFTGRR